MNPFFLSLEVAVLALINIVVVGLMLNYFLKNYNIPGKSLIDSILTLPLVLPPVVIGFALLMIFSPGYALGNWLKTVGVSVVFSKLGAVLASSIIGFPLFYQTVRGALQSIDKDIEEVAATLGASKLRIFFTISLPLVWRGILTGSILAFCRALGEFGATILIAGNIPGLTRTMPLAIYSSVEAGNYGDAFDLVVYICALTVSLLWGVHFIAKSTIAKGGRDA